MIPKYYIGLVAAFTIVGLASSAQAGSDMEDAIANGGKKLTGPEIADRLRQFGVESVVHRIDRGLRQRYRWEVEYGRVVVDAESVVDEEQHVIAAGIPARDVEVGDAQRDVPHADHIGHRLRRARPQ